MSNAAYGRSGVPLPSTDANIACCAAGDVPSLNFTMTLPFRYCAAPGRPPRTGSAAERTERGGSPSRRPRSMPAAANPAIVRVRGGKPSCAARVASHRTAEAKAASLAPAGANGFMENSGDQGAGQLIVARIIEAPRAVLVRQLSAEPGRRDGRVWARHPWETPIHRNGRVE